MANGSATSRDQDHTPVVKLFLPGTGFTWLINEMDPHEPIAFGLCDLDMGSPELGYVDLDELLSLKTPWGTSVERDTFFEGKYPMSVYAEAARYRKFINLDEDLLQTLSTAKKNQFHLKL